MPSPAQPPVPSSSSASSSASATPLATLRIVEQTGVETQEFQAHGQSTRLHYVIKNQWFHVDVAMSAPECGLNFRRSPIKATLLYDGTGDEDKEVSKVKAEPLEYKAKVDPYDFHRCRVHAKISVLTTQHEEMNFRLRIEVVDAETREPVPGVCLYSEPIQAISKMGVLKGKYGPRKSELSEAKAARAKAKANKVASVGVGKKRARGGGADATDEVLARLHSLEALQKDILSRLNTSAPAAAAAAAAAPSGTGLDALAEGSDERFRRLFCELVREYTDTPLEERPGKVRRTVHSVREGGHLGDATELSMHLVCVAQEDIGRAKSDQAAAAEAAAAGEAACAHMGKHEEGSSYPVCLEMPPSTPDEDFLMSMIESYTYGGDFPTGTPSAFK